MTEILTVKKRRKQPKKFSPSHDPTANIPLWVGIYNAVVSTARLAWTFLHHGS